MIGIAMFDIFVYTSMEFFDKGEIELYCTVKE